MAAHQASHPWDSLSKNTGVGCHLLLQCMKVKSESEVVSCVWLLATPWTAAHQAPSSMGFSKQEYWSGSLLQDGQIFSHQFLVVLKCPTPLLGRDILTKLGTTLVMGRFSAPRALQLLVTAEEPVTPSPIGRDQNQLETPGEKQQITWTLLPQRFRDSPHLFAQALSCDFLDLDLGPSGKILQYVDDLICRWGKCPIKCDSNSKLFGKEGI